MRRQMYASGRVSPHSVFAGFRVLGRVRPKRSSEIRASRLSIGFETLDRRMFDPEVTYPHLGELGVKWARVQTGWARCEEVPGEFDFAWLDSVVDSLLGIGIQPWFNLGYGNRLYVPDAPAKDAVGWAPLFDDEARNGWLRFVSALVDRFGDRVRHYEMWNEPDIRTFWKPRDPNPEDYVELVSMTARAIRGRLPDAVIIGGAIAQGTRPKGLTYLESCLRAGLAEHIDVLSYHPYEQIPESGNGVGTAATQALLHRYGSGIEIWQGEGGMPSRAGGWGASFAEESMDEIKQAKWLLRLILRDLGAGIDLTSYFHTTDFTNYVLDGSQDQPQFFGLLRGRDQSRKPAYYAYQCVCTLFDADTELDPTVLVRRVGAAADGDPSGTYAKPPLITICCSAGFVRHGTPVLAYWHPADQAKDYSPCLVDLDIWYPADLRLSTPVLVDPLTQRVYGIGEDRFLQGGHLIKAVPLMDYPLFVLDRSSFEVTSSGG
jgi:hypothetical protein